MEKLTAKMQRFCEEYLIDFNATQAAIRAGYSKKTAYAIGIENLKKPQIKVVLNRLKAQVSEKTEINRDWIIGRFRQIADRCMEQPKIDSAGANRATEMLAKITGVLSDGPPPPPPDSGGIEDKHKLFLAGLYDEFSKRLAMNVLSPVANGHANGHANGAAPALGASKPPTRN